MDKQLLRKVIIDILDDEHGINSKAHDGILALCNQFGWKDITEKTDLQENRAFLGEEDAEELRTATV